MANKNKILLLKRNLNAISDLLIIPKLFLKQSANREIYIVSGKNSNIIVCI